MLGPLSSGVVSKAPSHRPPAHRPNTHLSSLNIQISFLRFQFVYCRFYDYYIPSLFYVVQCAIPSSSLFFSLRWRLLARAFTHQIKNTIYSVYDFSCAWVLDQFVFTSLRTSQGEKNVIEKREQSRSNDHRSAQWNARTTNGTLLPLILRAAR